MYSIWIVRIMVSFMVRKTHYGEPYTSWLTVFLSF